MQIETQGFLPQIPEEQPEQVNITDVGIVNRFFEKSLKNFHNKKACGSLNLMIIFY